MGEICGLKFHLIYVHITNVFIKIPPCAKGEFALLSTNLPFYEVNRFSGKGTGDGEISKIFFLDHFSPSFLGQNY
jgi:hypothetical protein